MTCNIVSIASMYKLNVKYFQMHNLFYIYIHLSRNCALHCGVCFASQDSATQYSMPIQFYTWPIDWPFSPPLILAYTLTSQ